MKPVTALLLPALCAAMAGCAPAESRQASTASDLRIGIVQCDAYLSKIAACLRGPLPEDRHAAVEAQVRDTFRVWKEASAHPQHRDALPLACSIMLEQATEELQPLGCAM